jgi:hypothetical protein
MVSKDCYDEYINYIDTFINTDINSWSFKSNPKYTFILEHVSYEDGLEYLNTIINKFENFYNDHKKLLIELCNKNDLIGNTFKFNYDNFTNCSPTNFRYILHSLITLTYIKNECNLNDIDIIEIGAGYGGLCFFIYNLAPLFNINIKSYSIFDLESPKLLQKKYLEYLNINNINFENLNNIKNLQKNSFLISNYAYSEISNEYKEEYSEKVINPYTSYGFITWNFSDPNNYKFVDNKFIKIINAYPDYNNFYVFYK